MPNKSKEEKECIKLIRQYLIDRINDLDQLNKELSDKYPYLIERRKGGEEKGGEDEL
jgi:hypothetical protein